MHKMATAEMLVAEMLVVDTMFDVYSTTMGRAKETIPPGYTFVYTDDPATEDPIQGVIYEPKDVARIENLLDAFELTEPYFIWLIDEHLLLPDSRVLTVIKTEFRVHHGPNNCDNIYRIWRKH